MESDGVATALPLVKTICIDSVLAFCVMCSFYCFPSRTNMFVY